MRKPLGARKKWAEIGVTAFSNGENMSRKRDNELTSKSDAELAADLRQYWQEARRFERELEARGYDVRMSSYTDGTTSVEIHTLNRNVL